MDEREAMARALDLAWRGWGRVQPNPLVGAVVLSSDGHLVGEGWHAEFGDASRRAYGAGGGGRASTRRDAGGHARALHPSRQAAAVHRRGAGRGRAAGSGRDARSQSGRERWRREARRRLGWTSGSGSSGEAAEAQNAIFLHRYRDRVQTFRRAQARHQPRRPHRRRRRAVALDLGRQGAGATCIGFARASTRSPSAAGPRARTIPRSPCAGGLEPRIPPRRVVFDTDGRAELGPDTRPHGCGGARPSSSPRPTRRPPISGGWNWPASWCCAPASLEEGLGQLRGAGICSLLVEGGGRLAGALLAQRLVDRFYWVQSPLWLGERGVPAFAGLPSEPIAGVERWRVVERRALGDDTLLVLDRR